MNRRTLACVVILTAHAAVATHALSQHSLTVDEGGHLLSGLMALKHGDFDIYNVNPPLVKMLAALPVLAMGAETPEPQYHPSWLGPHDRFAEMNRDAYPRLVRAARLVIVAFSVLGGWIIYRWAASLFGHRSGLVALLLWCICPNVIGWSGVVTVDMGSTIFGLLAVAAMRDYADRPTASSATLSGLALGAALLTKFTMLVLVPLWLVVWWSARRGGLGRTAPSDDTPPPAPPRARDAFYVPALAVVVLCAGFGFQGMFRALGRYDFQCHALSLPASREPTTIIHGSNRFRGTSLAGLPVPLPSPFVRGLDRQKYDADAGLPAYLRGRWKHRGWWYYYLYGMLVKLPVGTLVLTVVAAALMASSRRFRAPAREEMLIWLPAAGFFALISSQTGINAHFRYVLPSLPFFFIGVARVGRLLVRPEVEPADADPGRLAIPPRPRAAWEKAGALAVVIALACNAASVARIHPHELSYFNELAGGPENGWWHLMESNIDWGQDLLLLKRWIDDHPSARPLSLALYSGLDPRLVGLDHPLVPFGPGTEADILPTPERLGPQPGWFAVSVNLRSGLRFRIYDDAGRSFVLPRGAFRYFERFRPVDRVGYSIYIYRISLEEADDVRRQLGLPTLSGRDPGAGAGGPPAPR